MATAAAAMFSTAPILTRWVGGTLGPYEISFWRSLLGALIVLAAARFLRGPLPRASDWRIYAGTGLLAALHFVCYIAAVQRTTIAHALAIVYTAPVWTALAARVAGEPLGPRRWLGVATAVAGVALLVGVGNEGGATLAGDLLALVSALAFAGYTMAGRRNRGSAGVLVYAGLVYLAAALWTLPAVLLTWSSGGYSLQVVGALAALALLPLAVGHTLYNNALRHASPVAVNVLATQELTFGVLLGALVLSEMPPTASLVGALVTMLGAILVIL